MARKQRAISTRSASLIESDGVAQRRGPLRATYSATLSLEPIAFLTRYADTHARRSTAERLALRRQRALAARVPSSASDILLRSQLKNSCQGADRKEAVKVDFLN